MNKKGLSSWLYWAVIFLIVAVVAGLLGLGGVSGVSLTIAKWLAVIFVVLFIISLIMHATRKH